MIKYQVKIILNEKYKKLKGFEGSLYDTYEEAHGKVKRMILGSFITADNYNFVPLSAVKLFKISEKKEG